MVLLSIICHEFEYDWQKLVEEKKEEQKKFGWLFILVSFEQNIINFTKTDH